MSRAALPAQRIGEQAQTRPGFALPRSRREAIFATLMILPTLLVVFGVIAYPWGYSAWLSLRNYDFGLGVNVFIGLRNYTNLIHKPEFFDALRNTLSFAVEGVILSTLLGLAISLVLNESFRGRALLRSVMLVPWAMSTVVVGTIWMWLLDGTYGTVNAMLYRLGLIDEYLAFLGNRDLALPLLGIVFVWNQAPLSALLFLAGLQAIPPSLYRAAKMDGAGTLQRFRRITLPWLRPTLAIVLILQTINTIMTFELIYIITKGGPGTATTLVSWLGYQTAFKFWRFGEGSAILYVLSLLSLILAYVYLRLLERRRRGTRHEARGTSDEEVLSPALASYLDTRTSLAALAAQPLRRRRRTVRLPPAVARRGRRVGIYAAALAIALWSVLPLLALIGWSLSPIAQLLAKPAPLVALPPTLDNYYAAFFAPTVGVGGSPVPASQSAAQTLLNSLIIALSVTAIGAVVGSLGAYAFSRFGRWRLLRSTFFVLTMTRMIPGLVMVIPWYVMFKSAGLLNTKLALILTYTSFSVPLVVWVLKGYFDTIPRSVEQAALVDGCTRFQAFRRIALPLALPGLVAACIFSFLIAWNEFVYAIMLTSTERAQTIPVTIATIIGVVTYELHYFGVLFAVAVVAVIPPVLIAFALQRFLVQGMLSGSAKG